MLTCSRRCVRSIRSSGRYWSTANFQAQIDLCGRAFKGGRSGRQCAVDLPADPRRAPVASARPNQIYKYPHTHRGGAAGCGAFTARPGWKLVDADYSQIELRVLADLADDQNMIAAFQSGEDIHATTAAQVFGMPGGTVTPLMRLRAKAVNFGIVYGIGAFSLSQDIGVTVSGSRQLYQKVIWPTTRACANTWRIPSPLRGKTAMSRHYLAAGAICRSLPHRTRWPQRPSASALRATRPSRAQRPTSLKLRWCVFERLRREGLRARLILQVHDELLWSAGR